MTRPCNCTHCPAFRRECEGCAGPCRYAQCDGQCAMCPVRCHRRADLDLWLHDLGGVALDLPLAPQPAFRLAGFFPQLLNGIDITGAHRCLSDAAVAIDKVLTPKGFISRRAIPHPARTHILHRQWGLAETTRLICAGNYQDDWLEKLWVAIQTHTEPWRNVRALGFDLATSLNFSIYLDDPRLEHLINVKRTWLSIYYMQRACDLIPIPHLQWATDLDLARQLHYIGEQGFHTVTLNLQIARTRTWATIAEGVSLIREHAPALRFLFTGTAGLRRVARLAQIFPGAAFTSSTPHYLAQRYVRLRRDGVRLIKEPAEGHPDLILADNVRLMQEFVAGLNGHGRAKPVRPPDDGFRALFREVTGLLQTRAGLPAAEAAETFDRLAADPAVLDAAAGWLRTGRLDRDFCGGFPDWPGGDGVPHPALGELLDRGLSPLDALLYLADLACEVDEAIQALVGQAGY